ncbi:Protein CBG25296 [Caenorhabditis briggsae]|uniref:Protein CBG25296 n=1 Tax=Caenorhabditis briggsae TaxID=6238 RepID=B6IIG6_CAEBR|nr:Protein CBG25296 [Caenorhabditis briggsae]CAR99696.1 Protein CBG25296 [Caenorhabditis briggsae]
MQYIKINQKKTSLNFSLDRNPVKVEFIRLLTNSLEETPFLFNRSMSFSSPVTMSMLTLSSLGAYSGRACA